MTNNPTRIKRKSTALQPRSVEVVHTRTEDLNEVEAPEESGPRPERRKVVVTKSKSAPQSRVIRRGGEPAEEAAPAQIRSKRPAVKQAPKPTEPEPEPEPAQVEAALPDPQAQVVVKQKPPREVLGEPTFKFFCYRCGQKLMVPVSWANKTHTCGRCNHDIVIPPPLIGEFW